jgi:catechol-2,3-dioxygenase
VGGIRELRLQAPRLGEMAAFYDGVLGFPVSRRGSALEVQAGGTRLIFDPVAEPEDPLDNPVYHVAWAIPENKFAAAKAWLAERTPLLRHPDGRDEFHFRSAHRHGVYFADPAGNVLELIARHDLGDARPGGFGLDDILYVNHAGLVVDDLSAAIRRIESGLGLELVAEPTENFAKLGDAHRHLVLVTRERLWLPEFRVPARIFPISATLAGAVPREVELAPYPYRIAIGGP